MQEPPPNAPPPALPPPPAPEPRPVDPPPAPTAAANDDAGRLAAMEKRVAEQLAEFERRDRERQQAAERLLAAARGDLVQQLAQQSDQMLRLTQDLVESRDAAGGGDFVDPRAPVLLVRKQTDGTWTEVLPVSGSLADGGAGFRNCSSSSHASALIASSGASNGTFTLVIEYADPPDHRYVQVPLGTVAFLFRPASSLNLAASGTLSGGVYAGRPVTALVSGINVTASTYSTGTMFTDPGTSNSYCTNGAEMGTTTHDLLSTSSTAALILAIDLGQTASDGKPIYQGIMVFPGCS